MTLWRADLLSDTVTRPTPAMRQAMARAEVGDDVFGEDPTVQALQERVAGLLGHEAALFTPSGSMANQLGLRLHVRPGEELLCDSLAHVVRAELGAAAAFSGITSRTWTAPRGLLDPPDPIALLQTGVGPYQVCTSLVVVENTHNFGGGTVQPLWAIRQVRAATRPRGVAMHLDGARLWNAHVASGVALAEYAAHFDTVSVCLSKGLGAPVGSLLVGSADAIAEARIWRKRFGGGARRRCCREGCPRVCRGARGVAPRVAPRRRRCGHGLRDRCRHHSAEGSADALIERHQQWAAAWPPARIPHTRRGFRDQQTRMRPNPSHSPGASRPAGRFVVLSPCDESFVMRW